MAVVTAPKSRKHVTVRRCGDDQTRGGLAEAECRPLLHGNGSGRNYDAIGIEFNVGIEFDATVGPQ